MEIENIGIVGAGQMGLGIAHVFSLSGYKIFLNDINQDALDSSKSKINKSMDRQIRKNLISIDEKEKGLNNIKTHKSIKSLTDCQIIIEAITEDETLKMKVFEKIIPAIHKDTILTSNTSSISITRLASSTDRPEKFMGFHFMNPVPVMKLVELIRGIATSTETFDILKEVVKKINKTATFSEDFPAFIVNRVLMPMINEAIYALYEGVGDVMNIDESMKLGAAHKMGPLELADFIGLDTCLSIMNVLHDGLGDTKYRPCPLLVKYVEAGWIGRKSKKGFYDYNSEIPIPTR